MKKNAVRFTTILIACLLLLSACGFHLANQQQVPKQLHTLYIKSSNPYGKLTRGISEALTMRQVNVTNNPGSAPFTLQINTSDLSETQTSQGTDQLTREFDLRLTATFTLINNKNHHIVRSTTLSSAQSITVPAGQLLSNSDQSQEVEATLQREITEQFFFFLSSSDTHKAIISSMQTAHDNAKKMTPIEKAHQKPLPKSS